MEIQCLMSAGCKTVANMIRGKSPEEIRKTFNITNDFTPEEEEQIRRENEWAEDRDWDEPTASFYLDNTETTGQRKLSVRIHIFYSANNRWHFQTFQVFFRLEIASLLVTFFTDLR